MSASVMSQSVYKALISGALTYGGFSYLLKDDPNKWMFTLSSTGGSFIGDYLISSFFPTYSGTGSLVDTAFSAAAGGGSSYIIEKLIAGQQDYQMSNVGVKASILVISNALADYISNMMYSSSGTTVTTA